MATLLLSFVFLGEGVFFQGALDGVFEKAREEKKLVMVDVYTSWCGPCKLMDRTTFKDGEVRRFLTDKMIGYKIDAEKGEGIAFARKYGVVGYPCLLILDERGQLVSRNLGYINAGDFLHWAKAGLDK